ncbi:MAG TPA: DnaJ domain-containing protein [Gemmatimonadaceae bacterium]|nr:DnaJ domain-containing protein [Gemmatimonadaceae bacterium]
MPVSSENFYERLSLPGAADAEDILRAWRRLILIYPPERAIEESRRIQEAYDTLSDARSKLAYDIGLPPGAERWFATALAALSERDYPVAARHFKLVGLESPESHYARNLLGHCYLYDEHPSEAHVEFECLLSTPAPAACWWANDARALRALGRLDEAQHALIEAITRAGEGGAADYYLALADLLAARGDVAGARETVEEGVRGDDFAGFRDPRFPLSLVRLHLAEGNTEGVEREIARVRLFSTEADLRAYSAWYLAELARPLIEAREFARAAPLTAAASALDPTNDAIDALARATPPRRARFGSSTPRPVTPAFAAASARADTTPQLSTLELDRLSAEDEAALRRWSVPPLFRRLGEWTKNGARYSAAGMTKCARSTREWAKGRRIHVGAPLLAASALAVIVVAALAFRRTSPAGAAPHASRLAATEPVTPAAAAPVAPAPVAPAAPAATPPTVPATPGSAAATSAAAPAAPAAPNPAPTAATAPAAPTARGTASVEFQTWLADQRDLLDRMRQQLISLDDEVGTTEVEIEDAARAVLEAQRALAQGSGDRATLSRLLKRHNRLVKSHMSMLARRDSLARMYDGAVVEANERIDSERKAQPLPRAR